MTVAGKGCCLSPTHYNQTCNNASAFNNSQSGTSAINYACGGQSAINHMQWPIRHLAFMEQCHNYQQIGVSRSGSAINNSRNGYSRACGCQAAFRYQQFRATTSQLLVVTSVLGPLASRQSRMDVLLVLASRDPTEPGGATYLPTYLATYLLLLLPCFFVLLLQKASTVPP